MSTYVPTLHAQQARDSLRTLTTGLAAQVQEAHRLAAASRARAR